MKVTFIIEDIKLHLESGLTLNEMKYYERWSVLPDKFHLTFGKDYIVYGIEYVKDGSVNFLIVDDTEVYYPNIYPAEFFDIKDNRLSKHWYGCNGDCYPIKNITYPQIISFEELVKNKYFLNELLDCENNSQQIFLNYKKKIDNEFPDEDLKKAGYIEANWVECSYCGEIWENNSEDAIIICPKNNERNNNPLWINHSRKL